MGNTSSSLFTSLTLAMQEDGYVSYDRYLARDVGSYYTWECEECNNPLNDEGNCEYCYDEEDDCE